MSRSYEMINSGSSTNLVRPKFLQDGWTNSVLAYQQKQNLNLYLPCYVRTKLKNIVSMDTSTLKGKLNLVFIMSIYYGDLDVEYPQVFDSLQENVVLRFKIDPAVQLKEGFSDYVDQNGQKGANYITKKIDQNQKLITFSIRKMLMVPLNCQIFWSPFQYIEYVTTIMVASMRLRKHNIAVFFNLMSVGPQVDRSTVASYTQEGALGEYDLAQSFIAFEFTNKRFYSQQNSAKSQSKDKNYQDYKRSVTYQSRHDDEHEHARQNQQGELLQGLKKIETFQYGHFVYPVYRRALVPLFNLFFPIIILGFLNLGIFFQGKRSGKRLLNISALMVSYIAFLPSIRRNLPPSNKLCIAQILLFSMASLPILTTIHTLTIINLKLPRKDPPEFVLVWTDDQLFLATLILTLIIIGVLVYISLLYGLIINRQFNRDQANDNIKFKRSQWSNIQCDQYFNKLRQKSLDILPLKQHIRIYPRLQYDRKSTDKNNKNTLTNKMSKEEL